MTSSHVRSAEAVANIEDLLAQILDLVPRRSLARFKCVSKHWKSLITNLHLITRRNPKISGFFTSKTNTRLTSSFKSIPFDHREIPSDWYPFKTMKNSLRKDDSMLSIIQSCNGLFLCTSPLPSIPYYDLPCQRHRYVYVVNPTTNKCQRLASPTAWFSSCERYAFAFEPSKSPHYKLVCVTTLEGNSSVKNHQEIHMYSSETWEWKHVGHIPSFQVPYCHKRANLFFDHRSRKGSVYCNGAVHWIRKRKAAGLSFCSKACSFIREESDVLHYFDVGEERWRLMAATPPVPMVVKNMPVKACGGPIEFPILVQRYFGDCGGRLYSIEIYKHCNTQFDVMELEKDYSGWFVKHHVDLNLTALPEHDLNHFVILCVSQDDEFADSTAILRLHIPNMVISYNLRSKNFKTAAELANKGFYLKNHPYMETLACV